jgi:hypothetical protein
MIENYRTGLVWKNFMQNPEIKSMLDKLASIREQKTSARLIGPNPLKQIH